MTKEFLDSIAVEVRAAWQELISEAGLKSGDLVVLGCSSSEILGECIGKCSSLIVGHTVIKASREVLDPLGIDLAVQACEHLNRSLVVERAVAEKYALEEVSVVPVPNAGGAAATAAYAQANDPAVVSRITAVAGLDIGDTFIGMHVKYVQIPQRLKTKNIGEAHLSALKSRLPRIGGERARYHFDRPAYEEELNRALEAESGENA
ncbi:MAG: TIGR01440 family protein [Eubacteriales bacterium]|nr:TIGR01440 family protein [Eubacteriales bacterium]MDD4540778.1 TIGR01440 family protein [Eubacteriales bacterium]